MSSYSGTMVINATTTSQTITVEGDTLYIFATYSTTPADTWSGVFHISEGGQNYDVAYDISGSVLTTDSGYLCENIPASTFESLESLAVESRRLGGIAGEIVR